MAVCLCHRTATRYAALHACIYRKGVHSCRLNSVVRTDSTAVRRSVMVECTQHIHRDRILILCATAGLLSPGYLEKYAFSLLHCIGQTRNVQHGMGSLWSWFYVNWCIFREDVALKTSFTFTLAEILTLKFWSPNCCARYRVNGWRGTDGQTDRQA